MIPHFQFLDKVVHGFQVLQYIDKVDDVPAVTQGRCLRRPWKNSTHFPRDDARAIRTWTLHDIFDELLAAPRDWTNPLVLGCHLFGMSVCGCFWKNFRVSTWSQPALFAHGNPDIISMSSSHGGLEWRVAGICAAFRGLFRTPS